MNVGAANAGLVYFDQHVIGTDLRHRLIREPQARLRLFLDEGAHGASDMWVAKARWPARSNPSCEIAIASPSTAAEAHYAQHYQIAGFARSGV